jgi:hypothetical protein
MNFENLTSWIIFIVIIAVRLIRLLGNRKNFGSRRIAGQDIILAEGADLPEEMHGSSAGEFEEYEYLLEPENEEKTQEGVSLELPEEEEKKAELLQHERQQVGPALSWSWGVEREELVKYFIFHELLSAPLSKRTSFIRKR